MYFIMKRGRGRTLTEQRNPLFLLFAVMEALNLYGATNTELALMKPNACRYLQISFSAKLILTDLLRLTKGVASFLKRDKVKMRFWTPGGLKQLFNG